MNGPSEALAAAIAPDARRMDDTPSLHLAIHECALTTIHDVLADCGDNSPDVLASNIASALTSRIESAFPAIREGIAAEPVTAPSGAIYPATRSSEVGEVWDFVHQECGIEELGESAGLLDYVRAAVEGIAAEVLAPIEALHRPDPEVQDIHGELICVTCGMRDTYPCKTALALSTAKEATDV